MRHRTPAVAVASLSLVALGLIAAPSSAEAEEPPKTPTSTGHGGAVASVDPYASQVGIDVLREGGNAVDAAVATAAALGVTEPFSAGLGGGGFFVLYDAATGRVRTVDGRETAPKKMRRDAFIDPSTGEPYPFSPDLVTSGVSVGVPGTPATWQTAMRKWGTIGMDAALEPAADLAAEGFVVDQTFHDQVAANQERFEAFTTTPELFLPGGEPPAVGSVLRNPDLADTYRLLQRKGMDAFYRGDLAKEIVDAVRRPPKSPDTDLPVPPGDMRLRDVKQYDALVQAPTRHDFRGLDVYGMAPPSSGGSTVGEILNILEQFDVAAMDDTEALHHYLEASALAFADRGAYLGDAAYVDVPLDDLLSDTFAAERACEIGPTAAEKPVTAQDVADYDGECATSGGAADGSSPDTENVETTHLTTADRWGNVVSYTLTIEQTGGSGMVLDDRGFILNNELTDFSTVWDADDPNRIEGGKRPRSSMAPTIVLSDGEPVLALGSPGGSTIITTVAQILFNHLDRGMSLEEAVAAPRATQRNTGSVTAEPAFIAEQGPGLTPLGHTFTPIDEIGAAAAIELGPDGLLTAVAEPARRGGGSGLVVDPAD
jgi:gamma-glutamyltranspeptidase/glutathione hydrolase